MILRHPVVVVFDPSKKEHRQAVHEYMKRGCWGDIKFRFAHDPAFGSLADQVKTKMLQWYLDREMKPKRGE